MWEFGWARKDVVAPTCMPTLVDPGPQLAFLDLSNLFLFRTGTLPLFLDSRCLQAFSPFLYDYDHMLLRVTHLPWFLRPCISGFHLTCMRQARSVMNGFLTPFTTTTRSFLVVVVPYCTLDHPRGGLMFSPPPCPAKVVFPVLGMYPVHNPV